LAFARYIPTTQKKGDGMKNRKPFKGKIIERHHVVPSQFGTLVVDDSHITERAAKILRPIAFVTGQGAMMREDYERAQRSIRRASLWARLKKRRARQQE
jgi:hypothetical protein